MSHCTCDYHQEQNKKRHLGEECCEKCQKCPDYGDNHKEYCHNKDCPCHHPSEEKKDWEESFRRKWEGANTGDHNYISTPTINKIIEDIREKMKEERERKE